PRDILRLVIGEGAWLVGAGLALGAAGGRVLTRLLETNLYGVSSADPATFMAVAVLLSSVALLACFVPARRASRIEPMAALRSEGPISRSAGGCARCGRPCSDWRGS